jgi:hypothetical protein
MKASQIFLACVIGAYCVVHLYLDACAFGSFVISAKAQTRTAVSSKGFSTPLVEVVNTIPAKVGSVTEEGDGEY